MAAARRPSTARLAGSECASARWQRSNNDDDAAASPLLLLALSRCCCLASLLQLPRDMGKRSRSDLSSSASATASSDPSHPANDLPSTKRPRLTDENEQVVANDTDDADDASAPAAPAAPATTTDGTETDTSSSLLPSVSDLALLLQSDDPRARAKGSSDEHRSAPYR